jgi:hypothetical protein
MGAELKMRLNNILIVTSFVGLLVSFWNRNDLPGNIDYVPEIANEPEQTPTDTRPFHATVNDVEYLIEPEYAYDLTGMVVSYRHHEGNSRMHLQANDHLNMADVCVVWGDNTKSDLQAIDFWNGIFTCNVFTRDMAAWESFDMNQLSNNHLISDDEFIRRQARKIQVGDQIRVRGYLASYSNEGGGKRGTSTTRTDTGDGACETVFVDYFRIVQPATSVWRMSMWISLALLLFGLLVHFRRPYKPYKD